MKNYIANTIIQHLIVLIVAVILCSCTTTGTSKRTEVEMQAERAAFEARLLSWKETQKSDDLEFILEYIYDSRMPYSEVVMHLGRPIKENNSQIKMVKSQKTFEQDIVTVKKCVYGVFTQANNNSGSNANALWSLFFDQRGKALGYECSLVAEKNGGMAYVSRQRVNGFTQTDQGWRPNK